MRTTGGKRSIAAGLGALCLLLWATPALANCSREERAEADRQLWLNARDQTLALSEHLPRGEASPGPDERLLVQRNYVILYHDALRAPLWTAHRIKPDRLGQASRLDCFRRDVRLDRSIASYPTDFDEPIFDQGHMSPNADLTVSRMAVVNSFIMSNMSPQYCQFNRGGWQILESLMRRWMRDEDEAYVITGAVYDWDGDGVRDDPDDAPRMRSRNGQARVAIASAFFKILALPDGAGGYRTVSILLPHDQTDVAGQFALDYFYAHVTTVGALERIAGQVFFPEGAELDEAAVLWPFEGQAPASLVYDNCRRTAGQTGIDP